MLINIIIMLPLYFMQQVLSQSVSKGLHLVVGAKARETAHFADMFDKFFDCLNCSRLSAGKLSRNPFKSPYRSGSDWKLKVSDNIYCETLTLYISFILYNCYVTMPNCSFSGSQSDSYLTLMSGSAV